MVAGRQDDAMVEPIIATGIMNAVPSGECCNQGESRMTVYDSFPDYILGITHEIWEGRGIHLLNELYSSDIFMRSTTGMTRGNQAVIRGTRAALHEMPDRQLLGEDVVWDRIDEDSWFSSHRIFSTATHAGNGVLGAATGSQLRYRVIADCHAVKHDYAGWCINDEWLVRDLGAMVCQTGQDPKTYAMNQIEREGGNENAARPYRPGKHDVGPYQGDGNDHALANEYAGVLTSFMNAEMSATKEHYDRACQLELPEAVTGHGWETVDRFWLGLRSSFPDARFGIDHKLGRSDDRLPDRASIRWSLSGTHDGHGMFGEPTGADVHIMGISQVEAGPYGFRREFVLLDTTSVWKQILLHTG